MNVPAIQEALNMEGARPKLDVDGVYGPLTQQALLRHVQAGKQPIAGLTPIGVMLAMKGIAENPSHRKSDPTLRSMLDHFGFSDFDDSEIAWCGIVMALCVKVCGKEYPPDFAMARSWLKYGIKTAVPKHGDVTVLWRKNPNVSAGHVAFYLSGFQSGTLSLLGGNQSDKISIQNFAENRLLGFRRSKP